jgi:hypothetical protein
VGGVKTSLSHPLHVDFVPHDALHLDGAIGMAASPGRHDRHAHDGPWERDLEADLARLVDFYHADTLVTLLENGQYVSDELELLATPGLLVSAQRHGLRSDWSAIPDGGVPVSTEQLLALVERILGEARAGRVVVIHCRDGLGRTGLVASACLVALGAPPREALEVIRSVRPGAVETAAQRQCLDAFDTVWRRRAVERAEHQDISDFFGPEDDDLERWRVSGPGNAPISLSGAATMRFVGVDEEAARLGISASPLRPGDVFHIMPGTSLTIGRSGACDVSIASSQLSRVHTLVAFVPVADHHLVIADLDSRNGTWIDDRECAVCFLAPGKTFALARAFRFSFESIG